MIKNSLQKQFPARLLHSQEHPFCISSTILNKLNTSPLDRGSRLRVQTTEWSEQDCFAQNLHTQSKGEEQISVLDMDHLKAQYLKLNDHLKMSIKVKNAETSNLQEQLRVANAQLSYLSSINVQLRNQLNSLSQKLQLTRQSEGELHHLSQQINLLKQIHQNQKSQSTKKTQEHVKRQGQYKSEIAQLKRQIESRRQADLRTIGEKGQTECASRVQQQSLRRECSSLRQQNQLLKLKLKQLQKIIRGD